VNPFCFVILKSTKTLLGMLEETHPLQGRVPRRVRPLELSSEPGRGQEEANEVEVGDEVVGGCAAGSLKVFWDALETPQNVARYYSRLSTAFGWRFVAMVSIVYGFNQGVGEAWFEFGSQYLLSDPKPDGFELDADRIQSINGFANVPWQIKSVYGILSDTFPIGGLNRTPYVIAAGITGVFAWSTLWLWPLLTVGLAGTFLFLGNLSVASPDVMIDASVAERCRTHPRFASDLQTLCWASLGLGKIIAASSMGFLFDLVGSRGLFALTALTSVAMLIPACMGWLTEDRKSIVTPVSVQRICDKLSTALEDDLSGPIYKLSIFVVLVSMSMGIVAKESTNDSLIFFAAAACVVFLSLVIYAFEARISTKLAKATVYIFVSNALQPSSQLVFLWSKYDERACGNDQPCEGDYCPRPCFSPRFLSVVQVIGYVVFVLGTAAYNKYFSSWSYRRIWTTTQILLACVGVLDFIFVKRWNLALGISDKAFVLGDEIVSDLIARLNTMPLFILAAATCPEGVEATLFAMNMGLSNFGSTLGEYHAVGLMWMLGGIEQPRFDRLEHYVVLRSLARLLPIVLIPYLVPEGTPDTELAEYSRASTDLPENRVPQTFSAGSQSSFGFRSDLVSE